MNNDYSTASGAVISACGAYRYRLWRRWKATGPTMVWIMLNPSTADTAVDDPTIRRCIGYAKREGCSAIVVVNLFALRSKHPSALKCCDDPVGTHNAWFMREAFGWPHVLTVAGWGAAPLAETQRQALIDVLPEGKKLHCLGVTKRGAPKHPLYLAGDAALQEWSPVNWKVAESGASTAPRDGGV